MNRRNKVLAMKGKSNWNLGTNFIILEVLQNFIRISIDLNKL
jgi:hypothetical protein